jgi:hypothetical protein
MSRPRALRLSGASPPDMDQPIMFISLAGSFPQRVLSLVVVPAFYVIADRVFKTRRRPVGEGEAAAVKVDAGTPSHLKA